MYLCRVVSVSKCCFHAPFVFTITIFYKKLLKSLYSMFILFFPPEFRNILKSQNLFNWSPPWMIQSVMKSHKSIFSNRWFILWAFTYQVHVVWVVPFRDFELDNQKVWKYFLKIIFYIFLPIINCKYMFNSAQVIMYIC